MIKKIKENEYVVKIQELLKNRRTRALVSLGLWLIFFVFVFSLLGKEEKPNLPKPVVIESNYEYQMTFVVNEATYLIHGVRNGNEESFSLLNQTYFLEHDQLYLFFNDTKVLQSSTSLLNIDFLKLRPEFLKKLVLEENLEYTTKYESGVIKKGYSVPVSKFVELYDGSVITDDQLISIELSEKDGLLIEVHMDLVNFQKYSQEMITNYEIKIVYSHIGDEVNTKLE